MVHELFSVRRAEVNERDWALRLALHELDRDQQASLVDSLLPIAAQGIDPLATLTVGCCGRRVESAAWVQPMIGKSGALWIGTARNDDNPQLMKQTAELALRTSAAFDLEIVQVLADPVDSQRPELLRSLGMTELAQLHYFEWHVEWQLPEASTLPLEFVGRAEDRRDLLCDLVADSYAETRDCPALSGLRSIRATIEGYLAAGDYDPNLWFTVNCEGEPAALLLLTPYLELRQWELTYLGVVPRWRGKGIGRALVARAQQLAREALIDRIVLAADAANEPATQLYKKQGFRHWADRVAWYVVPPARGA